MKTFMKVLLILVLSYLTSFAQDRSEKQIKLDTNTQEHLSGIIASKKAENEDSRIKLDEFISSWDKLNDLLKSDFEQGLLDSQLKQMETTALEISQISNQNIEAINQVKSELSNRVPLTKTKPAMPEKTAPTGLRNWSEIVRNQSQKSTTPQVHDILVASQNTTIRLQEDVARLLQSLNELDNNLEKLEAERSEIEAKRQEVKLSNISELLRDMDSQSSDLKEMIKNILKVLKEDQERKEQAVQMIRS